MRSGGRAQPVPEGHYEIRKAFRVSETAWLLGLSYAATLALIHSGELPAIRVGQKLIVSKGAINQWLASAERRTA